MVVKKHGKICPRQSEMHLPSLASRKLSQQINGVQVPNQPGGGKYPDPANDPRGAEMTGGTGKEASRDQGARPGSELLSEDVDASIGRKTR